MLLFAADLKDCYHYVYNRTISFLHEVMKTITFSFVPASCSVVRMEGAEDALAGLELLREELLELQLHLEQVGRGAAAHQDLQLMPAQGAVDEDDCRSRKTKVYVGIVKAFSW